MNLADHLVADFQAEAVNTRNVLQAVPEDRLTFKPHEKSMSLAQLAGHLAENPAWIPAIMEDFMDVSSLEGYQPFLPESQAQILETLEKNVAVFEKTVTGLEDSFLNVRWTMRSGDEVLMDRPRHLAIREIGIHHWVHHRGQLTVYLRLLDVAVPGTYGPTADAPGVF